MVIASLIIWYSLQANLFPVVELVQLIFKLTLRFSPSPSITTPVSIVKFLSTSMVILKTALAWPKAMAISRDTKLIDVVNNPEFQKVWHIKKDEIAKCRDCEFRHICTDCRAYIENPEDQYSAPLKCGYNPYTCEWEEWSTNPLKQQAIDYYGMREIV
jgi:radical SAM protein with 4Fe4S-binding SPASM domain